MSADLEFATQGGREPAAEDVGQRRDVGPDQESPSGAVHEAGASQLAEVEGPGQRAAAYGGGGEPKEVGDRSRPQDWRPIPPDVRMDHREAGIEVLSPHDGSHEGAVVNSGPQPVERFGGARGWHGSDGRTVIGRGLGRRRNSYIDHGEQISVEYR
jgi:hypothetical protein